MPRTEQEIMDGWEFALVRCVPHWVRKEDYGKFASDVMAECDMPEGLEYLDRLVNSGGLEYKKINLPHDWAVSAPFQKEMEQGGSQGFRDRWGIGWYRKRLELEEKKPKYVYSLEFGGVYENCIVWVNGKYVGGQKYGYSSFRLDVTESLISGENEILVKVDNSNAPVDRWYSGCGIYRTVKLVEMEEQHLDAWNVIVHTKINGDTAVVTVDTNQKHSVRGTLQEVGAFPCFTAESGDGILVFEVPNAKLWTAETPNLYHLTLMLSDGDKIADEISLNIGIRQVEFIAGKGMYVNGKPVKLKGVCLHQEAGCVGIAVRPEIWRARLEILKEMGCNAIRASHHAFASEFLDLCDEMGFYIYEECFDKWTGGLYGRYFETEWQHDVDAMVKRDRNRPCIVIWGVGNEVENQAHNSMLEILAMLKKYVKTLDAARPVSCAINPHFFRESKVDVSQIKDIQQFVDEKSDTEIHDAKERVDSLKKIADIVDIIACNYQEQWYSLIHEKIPDKLILGTEVYQYFSGHYDQMKNYTEEIPSLAPCERDYCIGSFIWTGYDYLGESMGYPAKGWAGAVVQTNNERKPMYYILQSYWAEKPMVHFSVMDYSLMDQGVKEHWDSPMYADHWHFPQFGKTMVPYMVASNCEEVALYLNGERIYLPKPSEFKNRFITGFLPWQPGNVKVVGLCGGKEVCCHETVTPGAAVGLKFDKEFMEETAMAGKQLLLTVRAVDKNGIPCFRESAKVRFRAEEPARVMAVDNGDITGNESYNEDFIHLYHGCASVLIELNGKTGRAAVWADGDGLKSGEAVVCCE